MSGINVVWLRRNLRLHDNPALHSALQNGFNFMAIYIFDTTFPEMFNKSHHPQEFLLECLEDVNHSLIKVGGRLHVFRGCSLSVLRFIHSEFIIRSLSFADDSEGIWHNRNMAIEALGLDLGFRCISHVYHTLWDPLEIIRANGGSPPVTYQAFSAAAKTLGSPSLPLSDVRWDNVQFLNLHFSIHTDEFTLFAHVPNLREIGLTGDIPTIFRKRVLVGGESNALKYLEDRLKAEEAAFKSMLYQPNQARPNILGPPQTLSAAISYGAISVRLFYWKIHDSYKKVNREKIPPRMDITGQLMWREYFYSLVRLNPNFNQIENNPICLPIPWLEDDTQLRRWKNGQTGYPFIDAGMRQLLQEGWIHHTVRTAVAMFLTRGDLWLNWEPGHQHFMSHLVDGDLSISAGNWMWLSSSALDRALDCSLCIHPVDFGRRLEPSGDYIRRYVPELANYEFEYIHEPWKAPIEVQRAANCIIGKDYPDRMVIHEEVTRRNQTWMQDFGRMLLERRQGEIPVHCHPSAPDELHDFFALVDVCKHEHHEITSDSNMETDTTESC